MQGGAKLERRTRTGFFFLEWINALAAAYYFNYLFFYLEEHFGFGNRSNLLITVLYGFLYTIFAWFAGGFAQKHGRFFALRIGFIGMLVVMLLGGFAPRWLGYSPAALWLQVFVVIGWTISVCFTWPTLQALLGQRQTPRQLSHTAGIYNMIWAAANAISYLTSGWLMDHLGGEILFFLPAGIHLLQLLMLPKLEQMNHALETTATAVAVSSAPRDPPESIPHPGNKNRTFLYLAWIANPFAYVAIYGVIPMMPKVAQHLNLSPTYAGLIGSVWFWVRLAAFAGFWHWAGWHYRFRWLLAAFIGLILSFMAMLLSSQVWMLILAQVVFGVATGLIYYSSLFYSLDSDEARGKGGGLHEAVIGIGIFIGPGAGVLALQTFPNHRNAGTWAMGGLLIVGLLIFLAVQWRSRRAAKSPISKA